MKKTLGKWVVACATVGPVGRLPAPGTWGSVVGLAFYAVVFHRYNSASHAPTFLLLVALSVLVAVVICGLAEVVLKRKDPGCVILDEVVAVPLVFAGFQRELGASGKWWLWYLAGFLAFRFFDILKPLGVARVQSLKGGLGVVVDDLVAAIYSCVFLHLLRAIVVAFA